MSDPYKILGVSRNATDEEIKKAYRRLSRKYHPDANVNSPHPEIAEEKFKEIQQAYTQIMNEKQQGYTGGYQNGSAWGYEEAFRRSQSQYEEGSESDIRMKAAANYINSGYYREALNALQTVTDRNARWYFFSAVANQGAGNNVQAMEDARQAVNLEPSNMEYRQFLQNLEYGGIWYQDMGSEYEKPFSGNRMLMFLCFIPMLFGGCCFNPFC